MNSVPSNPAAKSESRENPLINLLVNVALPVFILNKFSTAAPVGALLIALALPLGYGLWNFYTSRKVNFISVLGLLNTLFTGGFALLQLEGIWFCFKEAGFPLLIGIFVFASAYTAKPFLQMMLLDTGALNSEEIDARISEGGKKADLDSLIRRATIWFSGTFLFSATMNFIIAYYTFTKIPTGLSPEAHTIMLNEQIASMTWKGYAMIFVPSIFMFFLILFFFFRSLSKLTGLAFDKLVKTT